MRNAVMDSYIQKNKHEIAKSNIVMLRDLKTSELVSLIFSDRLDIIAKHWVDLNDSPLSDNEVRELLKLRLQPWIHHPAMPSYFQNWIDPALRDFIGHWNRKKHSMLELAG